MIKSDQDQKSKQNPMGIWIYPATWRIIKRYNIKTRKNNTAILQDKLKEAYKYYSNRILINGKFQDIQAIVERISEEYCENEYICGMIAIYDQKFIHQEPDIIQDTLFCDLSKSEKNIKKSFRFSQKERKQLRELQEMLSLPHEADVIALLFKPINYSYNSQFISQLCFLQGIVNFINQSIGDNVFQEEVDKLWKSADKL